MDDSGTLLTIPASTWAILLKDSKPSVYLLHRTESEWVGSRLEELEIHSLARPLSAASP